MSIQKFRDRKFLLLLYPDCQAHMDAFTYITKNYDYASILHDKDKNENGELKKAHMHVIIRVGNNAIWSSALCKELGIEENYCEKIRSIDRSLEYLIHYNEDDTKYHYDVEDVQGPLKSNLIRSINKDDKSECEKVMELIEYIENKDKYVTVTDFAKYSASVGMWDVFRRSASIYINIINEHNDKFKPLKN